MMAVKEGVIQVGTDGQYFLCALLGQVLNALTARESLLCVAWSSV